MGDLQELQEHIAVVVFRGVVTALMTPRCVSLMYLLRTLKTSVM